MNKRIIEFKIGGVPPEIKPEWLITAVPVDPEDPHNLITECRTETQQWWGFGVSAILQMTEWDMKGRSAGQAVLGRQ